MTRFLLSRLTQAVFTVIVMSVIVFALVRIVGDPLDALLPLEATEAQRDAMTEEFGLDRGIVRQYSEFAGELVRLDFGTSLTYRSDVSELIFDRAGATVQLAMTSIVLALVMGLPLGVVCAFKRGTKTDLLIRLLALLGQSIPVFVLGLGLIRAIAVPTDFFPTSGSGGFAALVLPSFTIAAYILAGIVRLTRASMIDVLQQDYVLTGRALGLGETRILFSWSLKNAALPVLTFSGMMLIAALTGAVVTETVFGWPGMGRLAVQAVQNRDYPLVQGAVVAFTLLYVVGNLIVDLLYGMVDPRIRRA